MAVINQIVGDDGANTLQGGNGADLIYGFDPNGTTANVASISTLRIATGLSQPVFATAAPGDFQHLFVVERTGAIKVLDLATGSTSVFLDLSSQITFEGEGGLLGLAFDPDYAQTRQFYVNLTNPADDTEILRYQVPAGSPLQADPASRLQIIAVDQPAGRTNHKAGWLGFGPDGHLYVPLGDGGGGGDPDGLAQNPQTLLGKVVRLDVRGDAFPGDAARNYIVPSDNPFVGTAGVLPEIWALGLRNPFRASFDRDRGTFFIADVGQNAFEEVDIGQSGANYGWDRFEGPAAFQPGNAPGPGTLTDPIHSYAHTVGRSIIGGYVYRGESDGLQGQYFLADFITNRIFTLRLQGTEWVATERTSQVVPDVGTINNPTAFAEDASGNLYLIDIGGSIFRLTPNATSGDAGDTIDGLAGNDVVHGGTGNDGINGGDGNDVLYGGAGLDHLLGGAGADVLSGGAGTDFADYATAAGPVLANILTPGDNVGEAAGDSYISIEGLIGSSFDDALRIGNGGGSIWAIDGNDTLFGGAGNDDLHGMAGNDHLLGGAGADELDGGNGVDFANYSGAVGPVLANLIDSSGNGGEAAGDQYASIEGLIGSNFGDTLRIATGGGSIWALDGNDTLFGGSGNDDLHGQDGLDHLLGGAGADGLDGGAGIDFANYSTAAGSVLANLIDSNGNTGEAAGDQYTSIEGLIGSTFGDTLQAGNGGGSIWAIDGDDVLFGGAGNDDLHGGNGADVLFGSGGADLLDGGASDDTFVFGRGNANGDTMVDFAGNGAAAGDRLIFSGYGTAAQGATFTQVDATHWSINSADGTAQDVVTFSNGASIHLSDYLFV